MKRLEADRNVNGLRPEAIARNWDSVTKTESGVSSLSGLLPSSVQESGYI